MKESTPIFVVMAAALLAIALGVCVCSGIAGMIFLSAMHAANEERLNKQDPFRPFRNKGPALPMN